MRSYADDNMKRKPLRQGKDIKCINQSCKTWMVYYTMLDDQLSDSPKLLGKILDGSYISQLPQNFMLLGKTLDKILYLGIGL